MTVPNQRTWTRPEQLVEALRARWNRGSYLRSYAAGDQWSPVTLPIKGPTADEVLGDPGAVASWVDRWRSASQPRRGGPAFTLEYRTVRSRVLGANEVPARLRIETFEQLTALLGTAPAVEEFDDALAAARSEVPAVTSWAVTHPLDVIANAAVWDRLLATVRWIVDHDTTRLDIRHLDVSGIDTKFIEQHRKILGRLLEQALPPDRVDVSSTDFSVRHGFRSRPRYLRFRLLSPLPTFPPALTELELRVEELAQVPLPIRTAFIVENKASYLAFPELPNAIAIFGEGFGVTTLEKVPWLNDRELVYWGDIDTHGFAILHRLRERVSSVRSILMDRDTLLRHRDQLATEQTPTNAALPTLTHDEAELYRDLVGDRYGTAVRLEQERIRFSLVKRALEPWTDDV